ncbi:phasin family protein [Sphingomonas sp. Leaf20]|uniref:phasin family protein n=1 Tax=Sphingomonas sp. Leaf20 TaxID=1735685 RepID=UPI000AC356D1|nr:phasin family protein [Sphingomonas sp. Leaf20]
MAENVKASIDKGADTLKAASDRMQQGADTAQANFREHVADPAQRAGEAMQESGRKIAETGSTIGAKMIDQAEQNAREAFAAMREAASAKDLSDVMKIQSAFMQSQGQRSMSQAREIGELIMQFGRDAVAPLKGGGQS